MIFGHRRDFRLIMYTQSAHLELLWRQLGSPVGLLKAAFTAFLHLLPFDNCFLIFVAFSSHMNRVVVARLFYTTEYFY